MNYLKMVYQRKNDNLNLGVEFPYVKLAMDTKNKKSLNGLVSINNGTSTHVGVSEEFFKRKRYPLTC